MRLVQESRLSGIEVDSGALILADPALLGSDTPAGLYATLRCAKGHYLVIWRVEDGPTGKGILRVTSGQVWAVDPSFLSDLKGKKKEWAAREHLYGKFPTNGTITIHCPKNTGIVNLSLSMTKKAVKVE